MSATLSARFLAPAALRARATGRAPARAAVAVKVRIVGRTPTVRCTAV